MYQRRNQGWPDCTLQRWSRPTWCRRCPQDKALRRLRPLCLHSSREVHHRIDIVHCMLDRFHRRRAFEPSLHSH